MASLGKKWVPMARIFAPGAAADTLSWGALSSGLAAKTATTTAQGLLGACGARVLVNTVTNGATYTWRAVQPTQISG